MPSSPPSMSRHPAIRMGQLGLGVLLVIAAPIAAPLPGPAGTILFAGGLILILRNSRRARLRFVRLKKRWPRTGRLVDRAMRRPSTLRRRERDRLARQGSPR